MLAPIEIVSDGAMLRVTIANGLQRIALPIEGTGAAQPGAPRPRLADLNGDGARDLLLPAVVAMRHEEWQIWLQGRDRRFTLAGTIEVAFGTPIRRDRWGFIVAGNGSSGAWTTTLYRIGSNRRLAVAFRVTRPLDPREDATPCRVADGAGRPARLADAPLAEYCGAR